LSRRFNPRPDIAYLRPDRGAVRRRPRRCRRARSHNWGRSGCAYTCAVGNHKAEHVTSGSPVPRPARRAVGLGPDHDARLAADYRLLLLLRDRAASTASRGRRFPRARFEPLAVRRRVRACRWDRGAGRGRADPASRVSVTFAICGAAAPPSGNSNRPSRGARARVAPAFRVGHGIVVDLGRTTARGRFPSSAAPRRASAFARVPSGARSRARARRSRV